MAQKASSAKKFPFDDVIMNLTCVPDTASIHVRRCSTQHLSDITKPTGVVFMRPKANRTAAETISDLH